MVNVFAIAENYPELKADENFLALQKQLARTEYLIQDARNYYNDCVSEYNTKIQIFPAKIIAKMANFDKYDFFKTQERKGIKLA